MYRGVIRLIGWLGVLAIGVLSLLPGDMRPHTGPAIPGQLEHFVAYFGTASVLAVGYPVRNQVMKIAFLLMLYAVLLEIAQLWIPGRTSQMVDFIASSLGVWSGICIIFLAHRTGWLAGDRSADGALGRAERRRD